MPASRNVARTLMVGVPGPELDPRTATRLEALAPGGVILFGRNLDSPGQLIRLLDDLRALLPRPTLLALDQEGGRVSRLEPFVGRTPTAAELAAAGEAPTARFGRATGHALRALGFNVDFAPVVDLCSPRAANGIGDRSFGTDPAEAARMAGAFLDGLQSSGVAGCLKHFPGLGATRVDSHIELPTCERTADRLEAEELAPYRRLSAGAAAVMIGHAHYPSLDPTPGRPATLSEAIVGNRLRTEIGYSGLVVTDDLEMGAVAPLDHDGSAAVAAIDAGCDLVLYCKNLDLAETARRALAARASDSAPFGERVANAAAAVTRTAERWPTTPGSIAAWETTCAELIAAAEAARATPDRDPSES